MIVQYRDKGKKEVMIAPVELMSLERILSDEIEMRERIQNPFPHLLCRATEYYIASVAIEVSVGLVVTVLHLGLQGC